MSFGAWPTNYPACRLSSLDDDDVDDDDGGASAVSGASVSWCFG